MNLWRDFPRRLITWKRSASWCLTSRLWRFSPLKVKPVTTMIFLPACVWLMFNFMTTAWPAEEPGTVHDLKMPVLDLVFKVEDLAGKVQDLQLKETATEIRIELAADVLFDFDKANIRPQAEQALKQVATIIRERARGAVRIEGHTDSKGSDSYNQKLSWAGRIRSRIGSFKRKDLKTCAFQPPASALRTRRF